MSDTAMKKLNSTTRLRRWIASCSHKIKIKTRTKEASKIKEEASTKKETIETNSMMIIERPRRRMQKRWDSTSIRVDLQDSKTIRRRTSPQSQLSDKLLR